MEKEKSFVVQHVIDLTENASFTMVDENFQNKATLVIKDENMKMYFEYDPSVEKDFGSNTDELLEFLDEKGWKFGKYMDDEHRWYKYNPNPKSRKIGDCTLRSYCAAFDISWDEAFDIASGIAKENASMIQYVADKVLKEHFKCVLDEKYNKKTVKSKDRITVNEFALTHPYGTYILHIRSHQVTVKDGEYWDSWDCGTKKVDEVYLLP